MLATHPAVGQVVSSFVGDIGGQQKRSGLNLEQKLGRLSDARLERVEEAVAAERGRRYDAEVDDSGEYTYGADDDEEEEESVYSYIEPVADDEIAERQGAYDAAELEKLTPATRAALEMVEGAARLAPQ
jgi:hypothetical protein